MASKAVFLVLSCFLLINTKVSSGYDEEIHTEGITIAPIGSPINKSPPPPPPPPSPIVKAPPPSPPPAIKQPPPPAAAPAPPPTLTPPRCKKECIPLCLVRCKNHSRKNICLRACCTCCERCGCVPPGQYGNKEKCKCYAEMKTRGGKSKCP